MKKQLNRMTKDQLVKIAYAENVGEREFITEHRGPRDRDVIIDAIERKRNHKRFGYNDAGAMAYSPDLI